MMDNGQVGWETFFQGPISCHARMTGPMMVLLCINRAGTGLTCTLSRLLNILTVGGHTGSRCAVDWLQCEPDLIYTYLYLQHETAMLCLTAVLL